MLGRPIFWLAGIAVLFTTWKAVEACSCMISHPQTQYCNSDFAIIARPVGRSANNETAWYTVQLRDLIKGSRASKSALRKGLVYTALNSAMCGAYLEIRKTYLLTGNVADNQAFISLCGFNPLWAVVTPTQKEGLNGEYKRSCGICSVEPFGTKTNTNCVYNTTYTDALTCYANYGICSRDSNGICNWRTTRGYRRNYVPLSPLAKCLNTTNALV